MMRETCQLRTEGPLRDTASPPFGKLIGDCRCLLQNAEACGVHVLGLIRPFLAGQIQAFRTILDDLRLIAPVGPNGLCAAERAISTPVVDDLSCIGVRFPQGCGHAFRLLLGKNSIIRHCRGLSPVCEYDTGNSSIGGHCPDRHVQDSFQAVPVMNEGNGQSKIRVSPRCFTVGKWQT